LGERGVVGWQRGRCARRGVGGGATFVSWHLCC